MIPEFPTSIIHPSTLLHWNPSRSSSISWRSHDEQSKDFWSTGKKLTPIRKKARYDANITNEGNACFDCGSKSYLWIHPTCHSSIFLKIQKTRKKTGERKYSIKRVVCFFKMAPREAHEKDIMRRVRGLIRRSLNLNRSKCYNWRRLDYIKQWYIKCQTSLSNVRPFLLSKMFIVNHSYADTRRHLQMF